MTISIRSYLAAGVVTAAVGVIAIAPIEQTAAQTIGARLYQLSSTVQPLLQPANAAAAVLGAMSDTTTALPNPAAATNTVSASQVPAAAAVTGAAIPTPPPMNWPSNSLTQSAGDFIINVYNAVEPWFQWGWSVVAWAAGWVPIVGFFAQQINIAYNTIEPLVGALVYSFAFLIDGQGDLIPQTLANGVSAAWNNFVQGEIAWFESFFPPLPPIGSIFGAAATTASAPLPAAADAAADTNAADTHAFQTAAPSDAGFKDAHGVAAETSQASPTAQVDTSAQVDTEVADPSGSVDVADDTAAADPASPNLIDADSGNSEADATAPAQPTSPIQISDDQVTDSTKAPTDKADRQNGSVVRKGAGSQKGVGHSPKARATSQSGK